MVIIYGPKWLWAEMVMGRYCHGPKWLWAEMTSYPCICCKTLEYIIVSNINKHLALENILADCQHGFRSQRSCETQLVQFYHDLVSNLDRAVSCGHRQTDVIVMDFAKAFDKVPHKRLLYKLDFYGIRGSTHNWIDSWLSERS